MDWATGVGSWHLNARNEKKYRMQRNTDKWHDMILIHEIWNELNKKTKIKKDNEQPKDKWPKNSDGQNQRNKFLKYKHWIRVPRLEAA